MICADCAAAADGIPDATHCDEPGGPSWSCSCGHRPRPTCTATIEGPHTGVEGPVPCTRRPHGDEQDHESAPVGDLDMRLYWTDRHAGATAHKETQ